jgi:hypothetical protein
MVRRSTSQPQAVIEQSNSVILSADREQKFFISAASDDYISIIFESDNDAVVSNNTADDENNILSLGEIMRRLRKENPAQFQRLIKDDTRD